MNLLIF